MHSCSAGEPYIAVDAGTFVRPEFGLGGVYTYGNHVLGIVAIVQTLRHIEQHRHIAAFSLAQIDTVHPYLGIAEYTFKLQCVPTALNRCQLESLAIPSHTVLGRTATEFAVAFDFELVLVKTECHAPVVGELYGLPFAIVEALGVGYPQSRLLVCHQHGGLLQIVDFGERECLSIVEVLIGVSSVSFGKRPVFVHQHSLTHVLCL